MRAWQGEVRRETQGRVLDARASSMAPSSRCAVGVIVADGGETDKNTYTKKSTSNDGLFWHSFMTATPPVPRKTMRLRHGCGISKRVCWLLGMVILEARDGYAGLPWTARARQTAPGVAHGGAIIPCRPAFGIAENCGTPGLPSLKSIRLSAAEPSRGCRTGGRQRHLLPAAL